MNQQCRWRSCIFTFVATGGGTGLGRWGGTQKWLSRYWNCGWVCWNSNNEWPLGLGIRNYIWLILMYHPFGNQKLYRDYITPCDLCRECGNHVQIYYIPLDLDLFRIQVCPIRKGLHRSNPILFGWDWNPKNPLKKCLVLRDKSINHLKSLSSGQQKTTWMSQQVSKRLVSGL